MKNYFLSIALLLFVSTNLVNAQVMKVNVPMLKLNNGIEMPQLGIGTYTASNEACRDACLVALKNGYRHIDTAHAYGNESGVGAAVKESGIPREEIWITSKLWPSEYGEGITMAAIDKMLVRLQTTYIDLLYVHQPVGDFVGAWKDMEKALEEGKIRALGISNFDDSDEVFHAIVDKMKIKPAVMQIECHPYAQRNDIREKVKPYGIAIECWYPLGHGDYGLLSDPVIAKIAEAHNKSIVQIILRWHIQEGFSVIPGATNPYYIKENINIFDFQLNDADMATMRSLNKNKRFFNMTLEQKQGFVNFKMND
ncbi:MAG: Aldehyde reductase [Bacteroidetes bacterium]|nr:Aldehyde reductase [Bacteroidota bacterium]